MNYKRILQPIVAFRDFFGKDAPIDHLLLLRKYPTDAILLILCKTNAALFQTGLEENAVQQLVLREIFPNLSQTIRKRVVNMILNRQTEDEEAKTLFFNAQAITWLINECFKEYTPVDESIQINTIQLENDIFESILVANGNFFNEGVGSSLNSYETVWKLSLRQQSYMRNIVWTMQQGAIKMLLLRRFIIDHFKFGQFYTDEFKEKLNIHYFFGYASILMNVIAGVFNGYRETNNIQWHLEVTPEAEKLISSISLYPDDFIGRKQVPTLHGSIVPKPFYYIAGKFPVIIDFNFLPFVIDTCLPYNFYSWTSIANEPGLNSFTKFKSLLGKNYYEEFVMSLLLAKLFPHAAIYQGKDVNEITDYILIKGNDIFLFEVKSSEIHHNIMETIDITQFRNFLDTNFLLEKNVHGKNKGVHQLAKCINILSSAWPASFNNKIREQKSYTIYPIIIYTDNVLDAAGVNKYCAEAFQSSENLKNCKFRSIKPLVMINQNFFLLQFAGMKQDQSLFKNTLNAYIERIRSGNASFRRSNDPVVFLNSCISFAEFSKQSLHNPISLTTSVRF